MSVLFFTGFSFYDAGAIDQVFNAHAGTPTITAGDGRRSDSASMTLSSGAYIDKEIDSSGTVVVGIARKVATHPTDSPFIQLMAGSTVVGCIRFDNDGSIDMCKGTTTILASSSIGVVLTGGWYYIEVKYLPRTGATGVMEVRVTDPTKNMVEVASVTATITSTSGETIDKVRVLGGSTDVKITDMYIVNEVGSDRNDFLGDQRVDIKRPQADGFHREWDCDSGTRPGYSRVDDLHTLDGETMNANGIGTRDSYDFTKIKAVTGDVNAVQVHTAGFKTDAGIAAVQHLARLNDSDFYGSNCVVGVVDDTEYQTTIFQNNPQTSARWTQKDVNNAEYGARPQ